ncbi:MAG: DUF805 domain-containing protein [Pseudomonadota bacterium]
MADQETVLDPKRPWIDDPAALPSQMNWFSTLFNPFGRSPKLHFTRAWAGLFMFCFLALAVPQLTGLILSLAGGSAPQWFSALFPVALVLTVLPLFIVHMRRLNDAGKTPFRAWFVFLPIVLTAGVVVLGGVLVGASGQQAPNGNGETAAIESTADGEAATSTETGEASGDEASTASNERQRGRRGRDGRGGDGPEQNPLPAVLGGIVYALSNIALTLWSLMWVARQPTVPREA